MNIDLTDEVVKTNNPQSLLEARCKLINKEISTWEIPAGPLFPGEVLKRKGFIYTYELADGRLVYLKSDSYPSG